MRCFLALDLTTAMRERLAAVAAELGRVGADVRWVPPEQLHVTLKFLGEIAPAVADRMAAVVRNLEVPAMNLALWGLGRFPPRGAPRVVWAGLDGDLAVLGELAAALEDAAGVLGIPPETRAFSPHVTLGRVKSARRSRDLEARMTELSETVATEPCMLASVTLYRSDLGGSGASYTVLERTDG